jgi:hypothetical protein
MRMLTNSRNNIGRRALTVAVCYVLILQAFLAAFGTVLAVARTSVSDASFVICHSGDALAPASGDTGTSDILPCALCAVAAAAGGLLPDAISVAAAPLLATAVLSNADTLAIFPAASVRAGLSRAPPVFA